MSEKEDRPGKIFHITNPSQWEAAQRDGSYRGDTLESEGFIHCSTFEQVEKTANRFYKGRSGMILLEINVEKVIPEIRYEGQPGGEQFSHIYGKLNTEAVEQIYPLKVEVDGNFHWPVL